MSDTPPSAETLREVVKRYRQPIYVRISEDDLTTFCAEISAGINTVGGAAARLGVDGSTIRRTMQAGAAAAARVIAGETLCKEEQRALWFYDSVLKAQGGRQRALTLRALGIGPKGGSPKESINAMKILALTCAEYREPSPSLPVPDEKPPAPVEPTPEQTEAYLRREAARLGYRLTRGSDP
jgi:hypothetical protein